MVVKLFSHPSQFLEPSRPFPTFAPFYFQSSAEILHTLITKLKC